MEAANTLYALVDRLVRLACSLKLSISVENPANSWFWSLPVIQRMTRSMSGCFTTFDMCVHGGSRAKAATFWANSQKCPGNHKHDSWAPRIVDGRPHYPTKAEAAYPALLCQRIAALVRRHCCPDSLPPPILALPRPSYVVPWTSNPAKQRPSSKNTPPWTCGPSHGRPCVSTAASQGLPERIPASWFLGETYGLA